MEAVSSRPVCVTGVLLLALALLTACQDGAGSDGSKQGEARFSILVFSKTAGYRHASIPDGIRALQRLGREHDFAVEATEEASVFTAGTLGQYEAVVFLNTTGDVLDAKQQAAFKSYLQGGGGFVGIHAAADTEHDWSWYGRLVGAYFEGHPSDPNVREATLHVPDRTQPSTRPLPEVWKRADEWYNYQSNPREAVNVLATVDESTYEGGTMGDDHPIAWKHTLGDARAWYTGGGHTKESFAKPLFLAHVQGGIAWAAGHSHH